MLLLTEESDSSCLWLVSSDYQLVVPATPSGGQSVTLSKSLWLVSPYHPRHTLHCHKASPLQWLS